jgi:phosphoribosylanthranilate isomerase
MYVLVKICGLSTASTMDAALAAGADFVGLVHFGPSPRHVSAPHAADLAARARGRAGIVLLTVDADDLLLDDLVAAIRPDVLQLHGREAPERVAAARERYGLQTWKAISVASADDLARASSYAGIADRILFDAKAPRGATRPGGNGTAFDWDILTGSAGFVLSGGLSPETVAEAISRTLPWAVDVSSGVESAPGTKSLDRIADFIAAARMAAGTERTLARAS